MGFADCPFRSHYVSVHGQRLHYLDEGSGPTLLFVHGNPTSSYLWRNVIKLLRHRYRCVALDLPGFGRSAKPDLDYRLCTLHHFLSGFVEQLALEPVILVLHDWGGPLGFRLAQQQPSQVRALVFMETFPFTFDWQEFPLIARPLYFAFRQPALSPWLLQRHNLFVNTVLPMGTLRRLPRSVMNVYRAAFPDRHSRRAIRALPSELPIDDRQGETWLAVEEIEKRLPEMDQPMLLLHFRPGAVLPEQRIPWFKQRLKYLDVVHAGPGLHFVPEDNPAVIADSLDQWFQVRLANPR
ncbi:haloalkane dehalogenase [Alcanivorax xiamenensis]|uniref:Haloalkane dehalogenase n=1 Tax=Alcanivorax xiamenensis TaxID=1177156 RepID=A0ABQ6Y9G2_9GAMM|nr:haloalkane dehalogenase [Alcanivorax xiamenensis]KAF0806341.1 haloalkane dehalogenase [Alcanivorax xiamenensis]